MMAEWRVIITRIALFLVVVVLLALLAFTASQSQQLKVVKERISFGEKSLIPRKPSSHKTEGMKAYAEQKWDRAISYLNQSLGGNINDPEALIFLNNAKIGSTESYIIAVSVPLSNNKDGSSEILRGVAQAQDEFNTPREKSEWRLKVAIASDDNEPEVAKQVATALDNIPNVLGVVGHYASDVTIAAKEIYTSKKLVAITPISTSVDLTKNSDSSKNFKPYVFRTVPNDSDTAKALKNYMSQNLNKNNNVAIFYNSHSNYSKSLACEFRNAVVDAKEQKCDFKNPDLNAKGQVREVNWYDLYEENFKPASSVKQVIDKGIQVLMLAADTSTLPKALEVVRSAKGKNLKILAGDDVYTPSVLNVNVGDATVGMVVTAFWHIDNAPNLNFVKKSKELWGAEVNWRTALAYDATQALIDAIQNNLNPTQSGVQQFLSSGKSKITGASRDIEFSPSGDRKNAKVELVKIVCTNNSSTPYKFVPVATYKDKPSSDCPGSPTSNNSSPTPTSSPLPTATPPLTSTPPPSSSTTSHSVCRLKPESPESYKANVVSRKGLILRAKPRQDSESLKLFQFNQRIIILKENGDKSWQNACEEGTNVEGWVKAKYTKKVVE